MKFSSKYIFWALLVTYLSSCHNMCSPSNNLSSSKTEIKIDLSKDGAQIVFSSNHPGLKRFASQLIQATDSVLEIKAPAQVIASFPGGAVLFAKPEISSLYSDYLQSLANYERVSKNEIRVSEMFKNQIATIRDVNDAKTDFINAKSIKNDLETRLKALGLNPTELKKQKSKQVWLLAEIPENQLQEVQAGETVKTTFVAFPGKVFHGKVNSIGDTVSPDLRTFKVRIVLPNPDNKILPGMFAECNFGIPEHSAIILPNSAIVTVEEKHFVFIVGPKNSFIRREVLIASSNGQQSVISSGLNPGERVVTSGVTLLKGLSFGY